MKKYLIMLILLSLIAASGSAIVTKNEIKAGLFGAANFDPSGDRSGYLSFNSPELSYQLELKLNNNFFFLVNAKADYFRNPDKRAEFSSFEWLNFSVLRWPEEDTDRFSFEASPGIKARFGDFSAGFHFRHIYDHEIWYAAIDETTPLYPAGTGRTLDVITDYEYFDYGFNLSYGKDNYFIEAYLKDRYKSDYEIDFENSDKKETKQDKPNSTERTDYPFIYGIRGSYSMRVGENSKMSASVVFEMFEDNSDNYNNKLDAGLNYTTSLSPVFSFSLGGTYEQYFYQYDKVTFPENADPEDPELAVLEGEDSFTCVKTFGNITYTPFTNFDVYLYSGYDAYFNADDISDKISLGLGCDYTFDFASR